MNLTRILWNLNDCDNFLDNEDVNLALVVYLPIFEIEVSQLCVALSWYYFQYKDKIKQLSLLISWDKLIFATKILWFLNRHITHL